jgi:hypothetical protein
MEAFPSWAIAIGLMALLLLSFEAGRQANALIREPRAKAGGPAEVGPLVSATLALVSLLLGFTLALSLDRYEVRRRLVVEEASAISTTWLRDQLLDEPFRSHLAVLMRDYVRERSSVASLGLSKTALDAADRRTEALEARIWRDTDAALKQPDAAALTDPVLQATSAMFDLPVERRAALDAQVPPPVLLTVVAMAAIAAAITGYESAPAGRRQMVAAVGMFGAMALAITLIFELDEPRGGFIRVPQAPLDRVAETILHPPP